VRCAACIARPRALEAARAACLYDETSRDPILKLKRADRLDLAPLFARWRRPTPSRRRRCTRRLLRRRYNQAAEIARPLSALSGVGYLPDALVRRRSTQSQGGKSGSGQRRNVAGAFAVPSGRAAQVAVRRILLIDDVMTTGATAEACARARRRPGRRASMSQWSPGLKRSPDSPYEALARGSSLERHDPRHNLH
jgi:predicted amidophosphoribosyltransferase